MDMYKDMLLKMKYHKERVIKAFIKKGYYPREDEISERMAQIDHRLALFEAYISVPGNKMNVKEINHCFKEISQDLIFLYTVIEELNEIDLNRTKLFVEAHLSELENLAEYYKKRNDVEVNTTTLGTTLFFAAGNWKVDTKDNVSTIDLGEVSLAQGTKIACFCNANNVIPNTVKFVFEHDDADMKFEALPYNYNNDTYRIPGELEVNITTLNLSEDARWDSDDEYLPISIKTDINNDYIVMGGKNKMVVTYKDTGFTELVDIPANGFMFYTKRPCYITFYYCDGTEFEYKFNKRPNHTNFSMHSGTVKTTSDVHKIYIDADKEFTCSFNFPEKTGSLWASAKEAIVGGPSHIMYNGFGLNKFMRTFEIREYIKSNKVTYNLKAYMESNEDTTAVIESIYIKEID